jgi:hypothetical protein
LCRAVVLEQRAAGDAGDLEMGRLGPVPRRSAQDQAGGGLGVPMKLVNFGTIESTVPGATLFINAGETPVEGWSFTNERGGVVRALADASVEIGGSWSNNGTVSTDGGALVLGGSATSNSGTISVQSGELLIAGSVPSTLVQSINLGTSAVASITGTVENTAAVWTPMHPWKLNGGTVRGGTVIVPQDGLIQFGAYPESRLEDLSWSGGLSLTNNSSLSLERVVLNGSAFLSGDGSRLRIKIVTLNGTALLSGSGSRLVFDGEQTFSAGTIEFASDQTVYSPIVDFVAPGTITLGSEVTIRGGNGRIVSSVAGTNLVNEGTISCDVSGRSIEIGSYGPPVSLSNSGTIEAVAGASVRILCPWSNSGTINVLSGTLALGTQLSNTGSVSVAAGVLELFGTSTPVAFESMLGGFNLGVGVSIEVAGSIENADSTWLLSRRLTLDGGTIRGGQVEIVGAGALSVGANQNNLLENVSWKGNLSLDANGAQLRIKNVALDGIAILSGDASRLIFEGEQLFQSGVIEFANTDGGCWPYIVGYGTLTLGPGATVRGGNGGFGSTNCATGVLAMSIVNL